MMSLDIKGRAGVKMDEESCETRRISLLSDVFQILRSKKMQSPNTIFPKEIKKKRKKLCFCVL
jgi:hypothetical protein